MKKNIPLDEWGIKVVEEGPAKLNGKWTWNYIPIPSNLCDLCIDRLEEGKKAACAHHCLAFCLDVVPVEEISTKVAELGDTVAVYVP